MDSHVDLLAKIIADNLRKYVRQTGTLTSPVYGESSNMARASQTPTDSVTVGVSARHVHLSAEHLEALFGKGYKLTKKQELMGG